MPPYATRRDDVAGDKQVYGDVRGALALFVPANDMQALSPSGSRFLSDTRAP